jgi:hypothetical protein
VDDNEKTTDKNEQDSGAQDDPCLNCVERLTGVAGMPCLGCPHSNV